MGEGDKDIPGAGEGSPLFPETHVARCNPSPGVSSRKLASLCRALPSWNPHITWMGVGALLSPHFTEREPGARGGVPQDWEEKGTAFPFVSEPRRGCRRGPGNVSSTVPRHSPYGQTPPITPTLHLAQHLHSVPALCWLRGEGAPAQGLSTSLSPPQLMASRSWRGPGRFPTPCRQPPVPCL